MANGKKFLPLEHVTLPTVTTDAAAYYLNRKPQTLRIWACYGNEDGIMPIRINGRLAWPTEKIREALSFNPPPIDVSKSRKHGC